MKKILNILEKEINRLEQSNKDSVRFTSRLDKTLDEYRNKIQELKSVISLQKTELFEVKNMYDELLKEMNDGKEKKTN